jgi:ketosteroid isomerase-like protein
MSQENVEIVRRGYDAGNQGDWDAVFRDTAPDFEVTFKAGPNAGTHRGREAVESVFRDLLSGFDFWIMEPVEFRESGDQVVVVVDNRLRPEGGTSGEFEFRNGHVWTIRDGAALSMVGFETSEEALEAAGLSE